MANQRYVSDNLRRRKKKVKKIRRYLFAFACALAFGAFVYLVRMPQIQVSDVEIRGNSFVPTDEIRAKTDAVLDSDIFFFIPRRNIFLSPKGKLAQKIKENPAVIDVHIEKNLFHTLTIEVTEQEKESLYCTWEDNTTCFFINKEGLLYSALKAQPDPNQEIIFYIENEPRQLRDTILEKNLYTTLIAFVKSTTRYGVPIGTIKMKEDGVVEFKTRAGAVLITTRYDDLEADFKNFVTLFDKSVLSKDQLGSIEYIDLRFDNQVYYKEKVI